MIFLQIAIIILAILLIVNIILTLKAGKKEESNELTEIKNSVTTIIQNLKDTEGNLKNEFVTNRKESAESAAGIFNTFNTSLLLSHSVVLNLSSISRYH